MFNIGFSELLLVLLVAFLVRTKRTKHEAEADDPCRGGGRQAPE